MKKCVVVICVALLPLCVCAQSISNGEGLQFILDQLYRDMMPMCKQLIGSARLIGGFGALWYIGFRVWRSIASAEPVEVFGLLRPFALGFCILIFPSVIDLINGILQPTVAGTAAMVKGSNEAISKYLQLKDTSSLGLGGLNPANWIRAAMQEVLEFVFQTVALLIDTIRTFYLIVLAIIGPVVFGLSIYDGFQHLVTVWLARYVNVFLWLPVANIFGAIIAKIQENMITGNTFNVPIPGQPFAMTDWAYLAFLLIAIVGYCTVPSVASYIVNAGGGNALVHKVTSVISSSATKAVSAGASGMSADAFGGGASAMSSNMSDNAMNKDYFKDKIKQLEMFKPVKNIDTAFRAMRAMMLLVVSCCFLICGYALYQNVQLAARVQDRVYILAGGKAMEVFASSRKDNIGVEARDHVAMFHTYFFSLDPDEKAIAVNIKKALYLADGSAKKQYDDLVETGYISGIISGNVSQQVSIDSVAVNTNTEPYLFRCYASIKIIRSTSVVTRSLVTQGYLRNVSRSDHNPHGFLIERWETLENKDIKIETR